MEKSSSLVTRHSIDTLTQHNPNGHLVNLNYYKDALFI